MERDEPSRTPAESDRLVGTLISGKYRVVASVGAGGMGMIYRADQLPLGRPVALKILRAQSRGRDLGPELANLKKRFFREASILSKLQHPNIVTIYDYGAVDTVGDQYFMAMEFLSGRTLAERAAAGPLPIATAVRIASQIARGLHEAHSHGIVHRDLKPSNVMLVTGREGEERVKVIDFGIVKLVGEDPLHEDLTIEGTIIGSPRYMAPEQFIPSRSLDRRADIWALGVVLYRLLTGKAPFDGETTGWLVHDVMNAPVPRVGRARSDSPLELDEIVARCLERSPALRYATMAEVADALDALGFGAVFAGLCESHAPRALDGSVEARDVAGAPAVQAVRRPQPSEATTGPESMVAVSTRNGAQGAKRMPKVAVAIAVLALATCVAAVARLSANAPAGRDAAGSTSAPTALATAVATIPPIAAIPSAASVAPPGAASVSPSQTAAAEAASAERSLPSASKPPARPRPPHAKSSRDDDIPAMR